MKTILAILFRLPILGFLAVCLVAFLILAVMSLTSIGPNQIGIVSAKMGNELPAGKIIAIEGQKGIQRDILGPGWHLWYWPWAYDIKKVDVLTIPSGQLGMVTARDGNALPEGRIFAPEWANPQEMLDTQMFLEKGFKGPQSTVLSPGQYRYNPALFEVALVPATHVQAGEVAVVIAMDGDNPEVDQYDLVERGQKGIWREALTQGTYYLNPKLYRVVLVQTTQRVYTYQRVDRTNWETKDKGRIDTRYDDSIEVKSEDGFLFPVSVRISCRVTAENAPRLVALLGNPDRVVLDPQEGEELEVLEARLILPATRSNVRDLAEERSALAFLNNRTEVEKMLYEVMKPVLEANFLALSEVFIDNVGLDSTEQGRALLDTLTNKQIAEEQKSMYEQQRLAEAERKQLIEAQTLSERQAELVASQVSIDVKENAAAARAKEAEGEAAYVRILGEAQRDAFQNVASAIGADNAALVEALRMIAEKGVDITPNVMVTGGEGGNAFDALAGTILGNQSFQKTPSK